MANVRSKLRRLFGEQSVLTPASVPATPEAASAEALAALDAFLASSPAEADSAALFTTIVERLLSPLHRSTFWGDRLLTLDKASGFLEREDFRRCFEAIRGSHIYDAYGSPDTIAWRLHTLVWAAQCAIAHEGDFVECGVFKGDMAWVVATMLGSALEQRCFYLYDSFEGLSETLSSPDDYPESPEFLDFANRAYREPELYESVAARFAGMPHMRVVKGFLPEAFAVALPERIAYLHIDLNSPAAEIAVLDVLFERVVPGGVIVFDDYGWILFRKQREAEDEFMAQRGHAILELPTGQGLVIKQE